MTKSRIIYMAVLIILSFLTVPLSAESPNIDRNDDDRASPGTLHAHVSALAGIDPPRWYASPESMERAVQYIRTVLASQGTGIEIQEFTVEEETFKNVIATFGPREGERIVVGAHYDVCFRQPGADDNASGVAGLLELARLLQKTEGLKTRVDLVAYALEEPPFFGGPQMGSAVHARSLKEAGVEVKGMISLEMIGYFTDEPGSQQYPSILLRPFYPDTGDFIAIIGNFSSRKLKNRISDSMTEVQGLKIETLTAPFFIVEAGLSDHRNFWEQGYPAVMITDTSFLRNLNYHQKTDTPDTLDYDRMALVVDGIYKAVIDLARVNQN